MKPLSWALRNFSFLLATSKGRVQIWVCPTALAFDRFMDFSAAQGYSRLPKQVEAAALGERLTLAGRQQLGHIFHGTDNYNHEGVKSLGLQLGAVRLHRRRCYAWPMAGSASCPGTSRQRDRRRAAVELLDREKQPVWP